MKTTIKNLSTATSKNLGTKNAHQLDSKRLLLALTLCLSSSTSFNAAYCMDMDMEIETDGAYSPQRVAAGGNNDAFKMEDRDGQNIQILPDENQNAGIFEDPEFIKLWNGIKTADQKLQEQFDMQAREGLANGQVTILLGNSGVGKTALHKYLRGVPLVAKETDDFSLPFKIHSLHDEAPEEREIVIGTTYNAESTYPALRNGYFDCPGFEDTRGKVQKIINAYSIKKVFEHVTDFRLLLVASSSQFANRGNEFLKLIGNLGEMFNEDLSILRALNIVVTKSDPIANNMERLKATLRGILRENESISPFQPKKSS